MKRARRSLLALWLCAACALAPAQTPNKGVISGRVVSEDGAGLPGITVNLTPVGANHTGATRTTSTDDEGNFRFADLPPRVYKVVALSGRAYVAAPPTAAEAAQPRLYRSGDNVTLTMIKGGVITGRVTNAQSEPLIAMQISAVLVREAAGHPITEQMTSLRYATDDRGIYRCYGLTPGTYVVLANSGNPYFGSQTSLYDHQSATYHPSSTRDTAAEITVTSGGEATGVDIRFRGERGYAISGKVLGLKEQRGGGASATLTQVGTGLRLATSYIGSSAAGFDFYGVPDGEYEIAVSTNFDADEPSASAPRRVTVRGADVTGLELRLLPLGSIAGRIVIEPSTTTCAQPSKISLAETALAAHPEDKPRQENIPITKPPGSETVPDDKGEFIITRLHAQRYRLELQPPHANLYVKSIAATAPSKPTTATKPAPVAPNDSARDGVTLKQGERLSGVTITLAAGAASLRGRYVAQEEPAKLPARLRVHLLPAEAASLDDVLRYHETLARSDGQFAFDHLAPGKYLLVARRVADEEATDRPRSPLAADNAERAKLRKEAGAVKHEIELQPCQQLQDQVIKYAPPTSRP